MNINFKRLLHTDIGQFLISVILGLGLASLFQQVCKDKDCIRFHGPVISDMDGKIFQHGDECYEYSIASAPCNPMKSIIALDPSTLSVIPAPTSLFSATSSFVSSIPQNLNSH